MKQSVLGAALVLALLAPASASGHSTTTAPAPANGPTHGPKKGISAPAEMARLVPTGAVCYVHFASIEAAESKVNAIGDGLGESQPFAIADLLQRVLMGRGDLALLDRARPLGVAVNVPSGMPFPMVTAILPVTDPAGFVASLGASSGLPQPVVDGGYVGVTGSPSYDRSAPNGALTRELLDGVVSVRMDLGKLIADHRPMIEGSLGMLTALADDPSVASSSPGVDTAKVLEGYARLARDFIDSALTLDMALRSEGTRIDLTGRLTTAEGSPLGSFGTGRPIELGGVASHLDPDDSMMFVMGMEFATVMEKLEPFLTSVLGAFPEATRGGLEDSMESFRSTFELCGNTYAGSGSFGPKGMAFSYFLAADEPRALLEQYMEALEATQGLVPGLSIGPVDGETVEGREATRLRMDFDMAAMFGELGAEEAEAVQRQMAAIYGADGLRIEMVALDDGVAMVLGGDDDALASRMTRLLDGAPRTPPADLQRAIERVSGADASLVWRMDVGRFLQEMAGALALPTARPIPAAPLVSWGSVEGTTWHGGVALDIVELSAALSALQGQ